MDRLGTFAPVYFFFLTHTQTLWRNHTWIYVYRGMECIRPVCVLCEGEKKRERRERRKDEKCEIANYKVRDPVLCGKNTFLLKCWQQREKCIRRGASFAFVALHRGQEIRSLCFRCKIHLIYSSISRLHTCGAETARAFRVIT